MKRIAALVAALLFISSNASSAIVGYSRDTSSATCAVTNDITLSSNEISGAGASIAIASWRGQSVTTTGIWSVTGIILGLGNNNNTTGSITVRLSSVNGGILTSVASKTVNVSSLSVAVADYFVQFDSLVQLNNATEYAITIETTDANILVERATNNGSSYWYSTNQGTSWTVSTSYSIPYILMGCES